MKKLALVIFSSLILTAVSSLAIASSTTPAQTLCKLTGPTVQSCQNNWEAIANDQTFQNICNSALNLLLFNDRVPATQSYEINFCNDEFNIQHNACAAMSGTTYLQDWIYTNCNVTY